jgi:hypothetical protein
MFALLSFQSATNQKDYNHRTVTPPMFQVHSYFFSLSALSPSIVGNRLVKRLIRGNYNQVMVRSQKPLSVRFVFEYRHHRPINGDSIATTDCPALLECRSIRNCSKFNLRTKFVLVNPPRTLSSPASLLLLSLLFKFGRRCASIRTAIACSSLPSLLARLSGVSFQTNLAFRQKKPV